jgi:hypothetical protein
MCKFVAFVACCTDPPLHDVVLVDHQDMSAVLGMLLLTPLSSPLSFQLIPTQVQDAVIAMIVSGSVIPPVRLDLVKRINHPDVVGCNDRDCLYRPGQCLGNRLEIIPCDGEWQAPYGPPATLKLHIVHSKADRCKNRASYHVAFPIPPGDLTQLLLAHIHYGHKLLQAKGRNGARVTSGFALQGISLATH